MKYVRLESIHGTRLSEKKQLYSIIFWGIFTLTIPTLSFSQPNCAALKDRKLVAKVISISDGDTAIVRLKNEKRIGIRFLGVDTPETANSYWKKQPYSEQAKRFTERELHDENVIVSFSGEKTYNRCVGEIFKNGISHSVALIHQGYAWWYKRYSKNRDDMEIAQIYAKRHKNGLWKEASPEAPWNYRRRHNK